jgi:hypothetical protein
VWFLFGALLGWGFLGVVCGFVVAGPWALSHLLFVRPSGLQLVVVCPIF